MYKDLKGAEFGNYKIKEISCDEVTIIEYSYGRKIEETFTLIDDIDCPERGKFFTKEGSIYYLKEFKGGALS